MNKWLIFRNFLKRTKRIFQTIGIMIFGIGYIISVSFLSFKYDKPFLALFMIGGLFLIAIIVGMTFTIIDYVKKQWKKATEETLSELQKIDREQRQQIILQERIRAEELETEQMEGHRPRPNLAELLSRIPEPQVQTTISPQEQSHEPFSMFGDRVPMFGDHTESNFDDIPDGHKREVNTENKIAENKFDFISKQRKK